MSTMEIALLVIGVIIFALSFIIPDKKGLSADKGVSPEEIRKLMENELNGMKLKVNEATDVTVEHAVEKAERQLERVSNEKIIALAEYSDTIMEGIDKNHQELLFMYDMLNDKQTDLKNTVRLAEATAREVEAIPTPAPAQEPVMNTVPPVTPIYAPVNEPQSVMVQQNSGESFTQMVSSDYTVSDYLEENEPININSNDQIIEMSRNGMSTVDIARELGLGVGEVKLVIDLFKD